MLRGFLTAAKVRRFFTLGVIGILLAACDIPSGTISGDTAETGQRIDPNSRVKVALLVPSGSGDGNLENLANNLVQSARLAVRDFSGVNIDLAVYSTRGSVDGASQAAQSAVNNGAKIIIGPLFAQNANAVGNIAASKNVNVLSFSSTADIAGGNVFILGDTFENKANRIISFAAQRGFRRVALVSPGGALGDISEQSVQTAAKRNGVTYTGSVKYELSAQGANNAAPAIAQKLRSSGSTAVIITSDSDTGLQLLAQNMPAVGIDPKSIKYLGLSRWDIPASNLSLPGLQGGWFMLPDVVASQQFAQRFNQAYGRKPHPLAGLSYDGISAVAKLLQSGSSNALTKSGLTRSGGFKGTSGVFRFNKNGTIQRALAIAESTGSTYRIISGAPTSFSGPGS